MSDEGEVPDGAAEIIQHFLENEHGFMSWLDVQLEDIEYGRAVLSVPFDEKLTNPTDPPSMHGGVASTLIDTAGGLALRPMLDEPIDGSMATINLNVNYLQPATTDLVATAEVVRAGSTVGVSTVTVESETLDGTVEPVAVGQGAYRLFHDG
ncbi:PaaI family thioesterase [Halobacteriales archaeon QS_1_68_20]|nr:MAG: PaaI family thioesterase [Halobacteriales archaeon QS_1_68_20]